jgi:hypothetical protein
MGVRSERVTAAFARVPREDYVGPGPWLIGRRQRYTKTSDAAALYDNVLVSIDPKRTLNNGEPGLHIAGRWRAAAAEDHRGDGKYGECEEQLPHGAGLPRWAMLARKAEPESAARSDPRVPAVWLRAGARHRKARPFDPDVVVLSQLAEAPAQVLGALGPEEVVDHLRAHLVERRKRLRRTLVDPDEMEAVGGGNRTAPDPRLELLDRGGEVGPEPACEIVCGGHDLPVDREGIPQVAGGLRGS